MAKKPDEARIFTNEDGTHTAYRCGTWEPIEDQDIRQWIVQGRGKSYIETVDGERVNVAHYVPDESVEQFRADGVEGSRRRNAEWRAKTAAFRATFGAYA